MALGNYDWHRRQQTAVADGTAGFVCAYTSVCEEDAGWIDQYLAEAKRLGIRFAVHLDRCSEATKRKFFDDPRCAGVTENDDPSKEFDETHRSRAFRLCVNSGARWAFNWDIDETLDGDAPETMRRVLNGTGADLVVLRYVELWDDPRTERIDGSFAPPKRRTKFLNLHNGVPYLFNSGIVNGPSWPAERTVLEAGDRLACLHWGHLTRALRLRAKERWDRIYGRQCGRNPYGRWNDVLDETGLEVRAHGLLPALDEPSAHSGETR